MPRCIAGVMRPPIHRSPSARFTIASRELRYAEEGRRQSDRKGPAACSFLSPGCGDHRDHHGYKCTTRNALAQEYLCNTASEAMKIRKAYRPKPVHLNSVQRAIERHEIQLSYCSLREYQAALDRVKEKIRQALQGNAPSGMTVLSA